MDIIGAVLEEHMADISIQDITPLGIFFWRYVKELVLIYQEKSQTTDELLR
jgi:hypothetical protein